MRELSQRQRDYLCEIAPYVSLLTQIYANAPGQVTLIGDALRMEHLLTTDQEEFIEMIQTEIERIASRYSPL